MQINLFFKISDSKSFINVIAQKRFFQKRKFPKESSSPSVNMSFPGFRLPSKKQILNDDDEFNDFEFKTSEDIWKWYETQIPTKSENEDKGKCFLKIFYL